MLAIPWAADNTRALTPAHTTSLPTKAKPAWPDTSRRTILGPTRPMPTERVDLREGFFTGFLERDLFNPQLGDRLTVTVLFANALLGLVTEGQDLGVLGLAQDAGRYFCLAHQRRTDDELLAVVSEHDAVEDDLRIGFAGKRVKAKNVAFLYLILLSVGLDNGVYSRFRHKRKA